MDDGRKRRFKPALVAGSLIALSLCALVSVPAGHGPVSIATATADPSAINKIDHVVVIVQENRSFDSYFGAYPGADGIPMSGGKPTVCLPHRSTVKGPCVRPYVDHDDVNGGGPHSQVASNADINGGKMNGFLARAELSYHRCVDPDNVLCVPTANTKVLGYHTCSDIPNYCAYARNFVLHDHMYEPIGSWSEPAHDWLVSLWSARCTAHNDPFSCTNSPAGTPSPQDQIKAWTPLTYLFQKQSVTWGYYVVPGAEPDCRDPSTISCAPRPQNADTPSIWNPLKYFDTVRNGNQLGNIQGISAFYERAKTGTLPQVSWVIPSYDVSDHPPAAVSAGQSYVTSLVNGIMGGPAWNSTAIFLIWDDWGGFYDHANPPRIDENGYGIRVPSLLISPYAKPGYIDHQTLSFDNIAKFIEDRFLGGQRLDPANDGRPDPRPHVRENIIPGDVTQAFDFDQAPRAPLILPVHPHTTLRATKPWPPQGVAVAPGSGAITVTWTPPKSNGGSPITRYKVVVTAGGKAIRAVTYDAPDRGRITHVIRGLKNGTTYILALSATNKLGTGRSILSRALAAGAPLSPRSLSITVGKGRARVNWLPPASANGSKVTEYIVTKFVGRRAIGSYKVSGAVRSSLVTGLKSGGRYQFSVAAGNARGLGRPTTSTNVFIR